LIATVIGGKMLRRIIFRVIIGIPIYIGLSTQAAPFQHYKQIPNYVLPVFDEIARRAAVEGEILVELTATEGKVSKVDILSSKLANVPDSRNMPDFVIKKVIDALSKWEIAQSRQIQFQLLIVYKLSRDIPEDMYSRFSVFGKYEMPTKIIIEAKSFEGISNVPMSR
jgi:hypothetical protein